MSADVVGVERHTSTDPYIYSFVVDCTHDTRGGPGRSPSSFGTHPTRQLVTETTSGLAKSCDTAVRLYVAQVVSRSPGSNVWQCIVSDLSQ